LVDDALPGRGERQLGIESLIDPVGLRASRGGGLAGGRVARALERLEIAERQVSGDRVAKLAHVVRPGEIVPAEQELRRERPLGAAWAAGGAGVRGCRRGAASRRARARGGPWAPPPRRWSWRARGRRAPTRRGSEVRRWSRRRRTGPPRAGRARGAIRRPLP